MYGKCILEHVVEVIWALCGSEVRVVWSCILCGAVA